MTALLPPSRRSFLKAGVAVGLVAGGATGCTGATATDRQLIFKTLGDARREMDRLADAVALNPATSWSWSKTLLHCAQSIEYSMSGYPELRSALFQRTVGAAAFSCFQSRGHMSHDLLEAIPGASTLDANAASSVAVASLRKAIGTFTSYTGVLHPHFAFGTLTKSEYEQAHAMHIANHLSGFGLKA